MITMIDGMINVYKEKGYTSHDVVAKLRGILKQKKIGHTGTLDPDAVGVLPVCLGRGTKLCDMIADKDKVYEAVLKLGETTDTQDTSGNILKKCPVSLDTLSEARIQEAVLSFLGDYEQIPPMYSAVKVGGRKLYELAREGKEIERKPRKVQLFALDITFIKDGGDATIDVGLRVHCSKGTYIRTLCHDIGGKLSCGGCMAELVRVKVGRFDISEAKTLAEIEDLTAKDGLAPYVTAVDAMLTEYPPVTVKSEACRLIYNGNPFKSSDIERKDGALHETDGLWVRVYDTDGRFVGIYAFSEQRKLFKPVKMFL